MIFITMIVLSLIGVSAFDSLKLCVPFSGEATLCKLGYFVQSKFCCDDELSHEREAEAHQLKTLLLN